MEFFDPIITVRRDGSLSPLKEITENKKVINNIVLLTEIPSKLTKVQVTGSIDSVAYTFFELPIGSTLSIDTTNKYAYFSVDYVIGHVQFSSELNGETLGFHYFGQGAHYIPASRVYTKFQDDGNGNYQVTQSLQEMIDNYNLHTEDERIANEAIRESNEDTRIENEEIRQTQETARVNAENARVESGALIKTGGTMSGGIIMSNENGITFGNIKVAKNSSLNCLEISWI